ncbi:MAG: GRP family sugar transporter [Streptococcaceae bacterium]|jgi:glucose uptake protein|nr:GRP family sugar transporter [Streptococcaceae bacterium]
MLGILYALVPLVCWGSIGFVANKIGGDAHQQTLGTTLGAFIFALGVWLIVRPALTWQIWLIGVIGGMIWALGSSRQYHAMKYMGVSVAVPLSAGSQLVLGSVVGVLAFHEWTLPIQFILGTIAMVVLCFGFYASAKRDPEAESTVTQVENASPDVRKGLISLALSTFGFVLYVVIYNNLSGPLFGVHFDTFQIILPMSVGMILGAWGLSGFRVKLAPVVAKNMSVGIMWGIGNIFMLEAAKLAGLAIAFTFSQLGIIISIVGGILFLGEKKTQRELRYVTLGIVLFVVGAILLAIVKAQ